MMQNNSVDRGELERLIKACEASLRQLKFTEDDLRKLLGKKDKGAQTSTAKRSNHKGGGNNNSGNN